MWSTVGFVLPSIGPMEMIVVLAIVLLIFGPGKLPDVGRALGKSIKEFKGATSEEPKKVEPEVKPEAKVEAKENEDHPADKS